MVKATKSAVEKPTTPSTPAKVDAAPKAPRAKKVAEPKEVAAAPVEVASTQSVPETVAADTAVAALPVKMTEFSAKLQQLVGVLSALKNDFKTLEKSVTREMKAAQKASSKKRRNNANRKPSGFIKPTRISNELAAFLGKTVGTEMARTDVSKEINAYIQSNGLQDKKNGRKINPDAKLTELLKLGKDDELTYFNLQRFMKHHFIKPEVVTTA
jgi:chromatin remodeling complex protein RSC6